MRVVIGVEIIGQLAQIMRDLMWFVIDSGGLDDFGQVSEQFYRRVAAVFRDDSVVVAFAQEQLCDESWFRKVAAQAAEELAGERPISFPLTVGPARYSLELQPPAAGPVELVDIPGAG